MKTELETAVIAALKAGNRVMKIYQEGDFQIESKNDNSPLTIADYKANEIINACLIPTGIPIISEENKQLPFEIRRNWERCWIVDPLDGTKEFIRRNGEFTVNIALVENGRPILGVIYAPALDILYFAEVSEGKAFKLSQASQVNASRIFDEVKEIRPTSWEKTIQVVASRSHMSEDTQNFIEDLREKHNCEVEIVSKGSSLKFCLIAEGKAHIYPRYARTMEWDTAAGQAICEAAGLTCQIKDTACPLNYNKENLLNPPFLVSLQRF